MMSMGEVIQNKCFGVRLHGTETSPLSLRHMDFDKLVTLSGSPSSTAQWENNNTYITEFL